MYSATDRASFAVQIERIITVFFQKAGFDRIQAYITPYVIKQVGTIHTKSIR